MPPPNDLDELRSTLEELERAFALLLEQRTASQAVTRANSEGNPNHGSDGKFASSPGGAGHGKHHARRERRKHKLAALRKRYHREAKGLKAQHKADRVGLLKDQRKAWRDQKREHAGERKEQARDHAREAAQMERDHERELAREKDTQEHPAIHEAHAENRKQLKAGHLDEKASLRQDHRDTMESLRGEHHEDRQSTRESQRDDRKELVGRLKDELAEHGFKRKGEKGERRTPEGTPGARLFSGEHAGRPLAPEHRSDVSESSNERRLSSHRTHKASSAESIVRYVLRKRGWTAAFRRGELTDEQRLQLLDDVRQYAREWMRHEAEVLFRVHGRETGNPQRSNEGLTSHAPPLLDRGAVAPLPDGGPCEAVHAGGDVRGGDGADVQRDDRVGDEGGEVDVAIGVDSTDCSASHHSGQGAEERRIRSDIDSCGHGHCNGHRDDALVDRDSVPLFRALSSALSHHEGGEVDSVVNGERNDSRGSGKTHTDMAGQQGTGGHALHVDESGDRDCRSAVFGEIQARALSSALSYHVRRFFSRAKQFVREAIVAGAMILGGPEPLGADDLVEAERQAQVQAEYLDRFEREAHFRTPAEIADIETADQYRIEPMSAAQFVARAEMFGSNSPWGGNINWDRRRRIRSGKFNQERRVHSIPLDRHHACPTCKRESDKGWVPIGSLEDIGSPGCECLGINCDCRFMYRSVA